eukprot:6195935-Pleurochrysis_carterae.AAC.2
MRARRGGGAARRGASPTRAPPAAVHVHARTPRAQLRPAQRLTRKPRGPTTRTVIGRLYA